MYEVIKAVGLIIAYGYVIVAVLVLARVLWMWVFFKVDDDIIKPKDYLIDDLYDTNIGGKK